MFLFLLTSVLALIFLINITSPIIIAEESGNDSIIDPSPEEKPEQEPNPEPKPNPDPKPDPKPEPKPDTKPEPSPNPNPENESKPNLKPKPDAKPDSKPAKKPSTKPAQKPNTKPSLTPPTPKPKKNNTNNSSWTSGGTRTKSEKPKIKELLETNTQNEEQNEISLGEETETEIAIEGEDVEVSLEDYTISELIKMLKSGAVKGEVKEEKYYIISEDGTEKREVTEEEALNLGIIDEEDIEELVEEEIVEDETVVEDLEEPIVKVLIEPVTTEVKSETGRMPIFVSVAGLITILAGGIMYFVQFRGNAN